MTWALAIILIFGLAFGIAAHIARRRSFARFANRRCEGRRWMRAFPDSARSDIRQFLKIFIDAFSIECKHVLKFRPDDPVMDIYRALNPPEWTVADQMEMELFTLQLKKYYGVELLSFWHDDITLGEIFASVRLA